MLFKAVMYLIFDRLF